MGVINAAKTKFQRWFQIENDFAIALNIIVDSSVSIDDFGESMMANCGRQSQRQVHKFNIPAKYISALSGKLKWTYSFSFDRARLSKDAIDHLEIEFKTSPDVILFRTEDDRTKSEDELRFTPAGTDEYYDYYRPWAFLQKPFKEIFVKTNRMYYKVSFAVNNQTVSVVITSSTAAPQGTPSFVR